MWDFESELRLVVLVLLVPLFWWVLREMKRGDM